MWTANYNNDVGPDDEGFCEWWEVGFNDETFAKLDSEADAINLATLLNQYWPGGPPR